MRNKKAVVLLSGGLDSTTTLYIAKSRGYKIYCLIFDYGQCHKKEVSQAKRLARRCGCPYQVIKVNLPWGGSSLLGKGTGIPRRQRGKNKRTAIPSTYVPARNTLFIAFGVSWAETIGAESIFIGANVLDYSGYPDCRPRYFKLYEKLIIAGTKKGKIKIIAPLLKKTKGQIIEIGRSLGVSYELTWSCYLGKKDPCGSCDSCYFRQKGFQEAGLTDPLLKIKTKNKKLEMQRK